MLKTKIGPEAKEEHIKSVREEIYNLAAKIDKLYRIIGDYETITNKAIAEVGKVMDGSIGRENYDKCYLAAEHRLVISYQIDEKVPKEYMFSVLDKLRAVEGVVGCGCSFFKDGRYIKVRLISVAHLFTL